MTGAPVPNGADTVVPFEETDELERRAAGRELNEIAIRFDMPLGANVRPSGEDVRRGELVLPAGTVVRPSEVGVMASLGLSRALVIRRPVVSILSTGDELLAVGQPLEPGKIYDSNSSSIAASIVAAGGIPRTLGIARDTLEDMHRQLEAVAGSDLLVTSAGVSKGDYDMVKDVLAQHGQIDFWSVRMRPGKPLAFGLLHAENGRTVPHLGLPGNPVSAMVTFEQFARAAIHKMMGKSGFQKPRINAVLDEPIYNTDGRRVYARALITKENGAYRARLTGNQSSNLLTSMAGANGLAVCPEDLPVKETGETVEVQMLDWPEDVF
jgi:molybdopterin molybdotransferase